ncbi:hypothetical protein D6D17_06847 [Aureobasidium pullulans]|uniref:Camp independent regulatory protein n=1 Tax=Aureobasidium pullulans EXF-150 TaxID=1043002 RepID=A0A074Y701_AURPU|nr:uncharacterized protein M438DRAFT_341716 [Aureobasidium pullulans EXF-150]KEQ90012.1 hypothetical protein M438DRAFT_341716 [Aureobasidium pullulans EXF-150]THV78701.1 hypothetical protein D6D27_09121 [Aureobasidium pullulans]THW98128.1 hypothetical protein D6D17_06847 [Aureobasidium pullulans]
METYYGHVRTPGDAILLFEACRIGLLPRVQRRLSEKERLSIKSGSVFVWDEREAGMRRWTDGKSWSASRVSGSFLTYREMEGKRGGSTFSAAPKVPAAKEHDASDDGPDGYRYKPDGLIKQSFSITTSNGQHLHLISYFARSTAVSQNLQQPSSDPQLRHIRPEKGMYPESTVHEQNAIPAVTRGPMTSPAFANSPHQSANIGAPYPPRPQYTHGPMSYASHGWAPPSPMHTPPPHYSPYGYHHSPMQHLHPSQYPPQPAQHYPPQLTAFDRVPAPLSNNSLPAPPSHPHHHHPHHPQLTPIHNHPPPSLPQINHSHRPSLQELSSRPPSHGHPSIDPALANDRKTAPPPLPSPRSMDTAPGAQTEGTKLPPATLPPVSGGTTIPSISSLIHETSNPSALNAGRPASRSPIGGRPQDIPMHKMGYDAQRDVQALRHLDKATLRF